MIIEIPTIPPEFFVGFIIGLFLGAGIMIFIYETEQRKAFNELLEAEADMIRCREEIRAGRMWKDDK